MDRNQNALTDIILSDFSAGRLVMNALRAAPQMGSLLREISDFAESSQNEEGRPHKTDAWFTDGQLANIASTYRSRFRSLPLSYATARDLRDSLDSLHPIATASDYLKDSQRPCALKAMLSVVPPCGRVLELGGGETFVADILDRLGYEVWMVDPELAKVIERMNSDADTRDFTDKSYNDCHETLLSDEIQTRVYVGIQMISRAVHLRVSSV